MIKKFKEINIGVLIKERVKECKIEEDRIIKYLEINEEELNTIYESTMLNSDLILKFCKLLEYDFFRLYSQHLIFYSPISSIDLKSFNATQLPRFKKSIYTTDVIKFIVEQVKTDQMTKKDVMQKYNIPKTTLYKWLSKYN